MPFVIGLPLTVLELKNAAAENATIWSATIVVLTDRNDLDDQLFGTFSALLGPVAQPPVQAEGRAHLRELLSVAAGGVVFTTIHKFFPEGKGDWHPMLSDRRTSW